MSRDCFIWTCNFGIFLQENRIFLQTTCITIILCILTKIIILENFKNTIAYKENYTVESSDETVLKLIFEEKKVTRSKGLKSMGTSG